MKHDADDRNDGGQPDDLVPAAWLKFGQRNVLYIGFVALLIPLGMALDGKPPSGPRGPAGHGIGNGIGFALTLCLVVSIGYFLLNAAVLIGNLARRRPMMKALIGCALPLAFGMGAILARRLVM